MSHSCIGLILAGLSIAQLGVLLPHEPNTELARSLGRASMDVNNTRVSRIDVIAATPVNTACRTTFLKAGVRTTLFLADHEIERERAGQFDSLSRLNTRLGEAERSARDLLSCSPADGNAWLRLGLIEAYGMGFGGAATRMMERSQIYAPHERRVLDARLARLPTQSHVLEENPQLRFVRIKDQAVIDRVE